ncbi:hypothetical protein AWN90_02495 [Nocardia terpenica]|uniref:Uncharacterized protein n=1 Tax=Nocardia terpenica TaxID=455432 RepID=A0A164KPV7_9NOCA|nr:hypothetical protein AWN90_02495 [Nocardia terpenica]
MPFGKPAFFGRDLITQLFLLQYPRILLPLQLTPLAQRIPGRFLSLLKLCVSLGDFRGLLLDLSTKLRFGALLLRQLLALLSAMFGPQFGLLPFSLGLELGGQLRTVFGELDVLAPDFTAQGCLGLLACLALSCQFRTQRGDFVRYVRVGFLGECAFEIFLGLGGERGLFVVALGSFFELVDARLVLLVYPVVLDLHPFLDESVCSCAFLVGDLVPHAGLLKLPLLLFGLQALLCGQSILFEFLGELELFVLFSQFGNLLVNQPLILLLGMALNLLLLFESHVRGGCRLRCRRVGYGGKLLLVLDTNLLYLWFSELSDQCVPQVCATLGAVHGLGLEGGTTFRHARSPIDLLVTVEDSCTAYRQVMKSGNFEAKCINSCWGTT